MPDHPDGIAYIGSETLNPDSLRRILARIDTPPPVVALDTETISLKDRSCVGIGMALSSDEAIYFRVLPDMSPYVDHVMNVVCNPDILKVYHNAMFDLDVLTIAGEEWGWPAIEKTNIADTSILVRVQGKDAQLGMVAIGLLGMDIISYEAMVPIRKNTLDVHWGEVAKKCLDDCLATYRIFDELWGVDVPHVEGFL